MIEIYTRSNCNWCFAAKRLLMLSGLDYTEYVVDRDPAALERFEALAPAATVPRIYTSGRLLGGYDDLKKLDDEGELVAVAVGASRPSPTID